MNKLLQSLILTSTILTAGEVIGKNNEIIESKSSFTRLETYYLVDQLLKKQKGIKKNVSIRGYRILNPGGEINDDIRKTILEIAELADRYLSKKISLKGSITRQGIELNTIKNKTSSALIIYYNHKF